VRRDRRKFLFPFLGCNAAFGGNGLRGRFAGGGVNLLTRIGQKRVTCLASCMDASVVLAGAGKARTRFRAILGSRVGIRQGN